MGSFGKGSLRKLCHTTLVYQSFLAATLIAALHCISSCHNQSSIESLWNHCSWLQVGRQCNHSICTLQLRTTTHSASHDHPPPRTANCTSRSCGNFAEIFAENCPKSFLLRQRRLRTFCGNFAEIRRNVRKFFRRKLVQQMLCRMRAAVRTHFPPDTASENGSWSF